MASLITAVAAGGVLFSASTHAAVEVAPFFPVYYKYGGYPKVSTDVLYGSPENPTAVPTVVDLGSANFWVYGPNATVNYGSPYLGVLGPCNITAKPNFDYPESKTSTQPAKKERGYSYGGNGKLVSSYFSVNDTIRFAGNNVPPFENINVAIANFTLVKQAADNCKNSDSFDYDKSILGLSRFKNPAYATVGPSFRQDLLDTGKIQTPSMSMWFDEAPQDVKGTFRGTTLFGAIAQDKYRGKLVRVKPSPPKSSYVGYYIPGPSISVNSVKNLKRQTALKIGKGGKKRCLVDSGTGNDLLPISQKQFNKAAGLVLFHGYPAFNGSCDEIPSSAGITFKFPGLKTGEAVSITVPLRHYARGNTDFFGKKKCGLSMELLESSDCVLGAPFSTALYLAVNDDKNEIAIAQGGVSKGARRGTDALGKIALLKPGESIPGAV